jgi:hypothetical protein
MTAAFRIFVFCFSIFCCTNILAQDNYAILFGRVTDSLGNPIPNATIAVSGSNNFIGRTDSSGKYRFAIASESHLLLEFSKNGYMNHQEDAPFLGFQQEFELNVVLQKKGKSKKE